MEWNVGSFQLLAGIGKQGFFKSKQAGQPRIHTERGTRSQLRLDEDMMVIY